MRNLGLNARYFENWKLCIETGYHHTGITLLTLADSIGESAMSAKNSAEAEAARYRVVR